MVHLTPAMKKFVLHWGEMGDKWGVNRSVAQIHALLYVAARPLTAEEISETLSMARSNVSTSIRELLEWEIVRTVQRVGERKDHFEAFGDPWETMDKVIEKRRQREIAPTIRLLAECIEEAKGNPKEDKQVAARLESLRELLVQGDALCGAMRRLPRESLGRLVKAGGRLKEMLLSK
ncbi:MAG TPA: ArsR family transcriptional regulator [Phycisphaerales bacterium]|nr:ArsR family transcriptional regulator [Phycisphaerales bacterium]